MSNRDFLVRLVNPICIFACIFFATICDQSGDTGTGGVVVARLVVWQYSWWDEGYGGGGGR